MLFLESAARLLVVLHLVAAGVLLGASTHHLLTCRRYLAGRYDRVRLERLYALVAACAFAVTFTLGALVYPTYKVRVRAEYFDSPDAARAEHVARIEQAKRVGSPPPAPPRAPLDGVARAFDIKEHWVALGLFASLVLLALSRLAHPSEDARFAPLYVGLSAFVCSAAWLGAILGALTSSYRGVGA